MSPSNSQRTIARSMKATYQFVDPIFEAFLRIQYLPHIPRLFLLNHPARSRSTSCQSRLRGTTSRRNERARGDIGRVCALVSVHVAPICAVCSRAPELAQGKAVDTARRH